MASMAEQLAANINFKSFSKAEDLKKRLWFTLGALLVFRFGTYVPIPGMDAVAVAAATQQHAGGLLGIFDRFSGGALGRMSIFALGVMPYISASIIMQLMTVVSPKLEAIKKEGAAGQKIINQYTRYLTVFIATAQAYLLSIGLENLSGPLGDVVPMKGMFFKIDATVTLVGGTLMAMWLGEQITSRGVGNGISLLIFSGIVANLPQAVVTTLEMGRNGAIPPIAIIAILFLAVGMVAFIVFIERSQRKIPIQYPKRQVGKKMYGGQTSHLPLRINSAGVIPPIFAYALISIPGSIAAFSASAENSEGILPLIAAYLGHGKPLYTLILIGLISFFAFFYTAIIFNPKETADNLKKGGGFIPGRRPGDHTAEYLDFVLTRLTVFGAVYLCAICLMPEFLMSKYSVPFALGGTSLLIVVGVGMDTVAQIQSHLLSHQYENLLNKTRLGNRKKKGKK